MEIQEESDCIVIAQVQEAVKILKKSQAKSLRIWTGWPRDTRYIIERGKMAKYRLTGK